LMRTADLRWAMDNDDRDLYIALEWDDPSFDHTLDPNSGPTLYDGVRLQFDSDGSGTYDNGEDARTLVAASTGSIYIDQHNVSGDSTDVIGDGFGQLSYDSASATYHAEFLIPLTPDSRGEDGLLTSMSHINITLLDGFTTSGGIAGFAYGAGDDASAWPVLALTSLAGYTHPAIPAGLTGLLAFISDHQTVLGEIYTYDPAGGVVSLVPTPPNLYIDNVSLSHDRTHVAFHGVPCDLKARTLADCKNDAAAYEIYRVDTDGGNFKHLTGNSFLNGHPGWSPDDKRIVFASFRNGGRAALVIIDAETGAELADLSAGAGIDDNDPDFMPDGRLVFKTNRFTNDAQHTAYEVRIAVMNDDGSGVQALTAGTGFSDHDPVGDATSAIFERFHKDTFYATDLETGFTPWDLIEAPLAGGSERTVLSDGWVNWLPVYDSTGQYVAYLKSNGYNAAWLLERSTGKELGRLIPDMTKLRYVDWK
jgi:Tol biopolymer transport system component